MQDAMAAPTASQDRRPVDDPVFDEIEAGVYLGGENNPVSPRTMQRWRNERRGPTWCRVGRLVRYRRSALDRFLKSGEQAGK